MIIEREGWLEGSHDQREAVKIFNSMPKEELFLASAADIGEEVKAVLAQYYAHDVKATVRRDPAGNALSIMVIMPSDRYSGRVQRALQRELVRELDGTLLSYNLVMGGGGQQARLHFQIAAPADRVASVTAEQIENVVRAHVQTWVGAPERGLAAGRAPATAPRPAVRAHVQTWVDARERRRARSHPPETAHRRAARWGAAFSAEYQAAITSEEAEADLGVIEAMEAEDRAIDLRLSNRRPGSDEPATF